MRFVAAAIGGMAEAQFNAGRLAEEASNASSARRWYTAAARQGHGPAQYNLALFLLRQDSAADSADAAAALAWLTLAAEAGAVDAASARDALVEQLPIQTVRTAEALAARWRPQ